MPQSLDAPIATLQPGRNCAVVSKATRSLLIVDGESYFAQLQKALERANEQIVFIGWDFDTRVGLNGADSETLRSFIVRLLKSNKRLRIYILKWNFGVLKILFRGRMIFTILRWLSSRRLKIKFDGVHPVGASHHQKIVVVDGSMAFCGGIDATSGRWDTRDHLDDDPLRTMPDGEIAEPWHDVSLALDGPAAASLHELASDRWERATGKPLPSVASTAVWPFPGRTDFENVDLAISRTRGEYRNDPPIKENEVLFLDMIGAAKQYIYAENQYFASRTVASAMAKRLMEENPPEIVVVMPLTADGWLEQVAMDSARNRLVALLVKVDCKKRFRVYHPFTEDGTPIYVHAKLTIVDDRMLRVGSSNMNNRSLGFDSECDLTIEAVGPEAERTEARIAAIRASLLAEHLGQSEAKIGPLLKHEPMIDLIERLRGPGRSLRPFEPTKDSELAKFVDSQNLLDPVGEEDTRFEAIGRSGRWWRCR